MALMRIFREALLAGTGPELPPMRCGLIPGWWKKTAKEVPSTFNARAETVAQKPMFRSAFKGTRCIVPASGYYEWPDRVSSFSSTPSPIPAFFNPTAS
jgi:putative SOS response-associated peptidase YedK